MRKSLSLVAALLFLVPGAAAQQNNYYVSTTGSDSNDGSQTRPWQTINHADSALTLGATGTVVHVAPGTYSGYIATSHHGTASQRITYISDAKWGAVIRGSGSGDTWNASGSYTTIQDFEFNLTGTNSCCAIAQYPWNGEHDLWIIGNKLHDSAGNGNNVGGAVISLALGSVSTHNIVDGNLLYHNNAGSTPNSSGQHGIYSAAAGDIIRNNIVVDQGGGWCIHLWHQASNAIIENNTVANCAEGGFEIGNDGALSPTVNDYTTVNNNISINNAGPYGGFRESGNTGTHNVYQNNLAYGNSAGSFILQNGLTANGTQTGSNSATFVNYTGTGAGDYHSIPGSTTISNGTTTCAATVSNCAPTTDFDGISRPQGTAWSIGAYEFVARPSPPSALQATVQ
jgi:hypothetical protein